VATCPYKYIVATTGKKEAWDNLKKELNAWK